MHHVRFGEHNAVHTEHGVVRSRSAHLVGRELPHHVRFRTLAAAPLEQHQVRVAPWARTRYERDMAPKTHRRGNHDG